MQRKTLLWLLIAIVSLFSTGCCAACKYGSTALQQFQTSANPPPTGLMARPVAIPVQSLLVKDPPCAAQSQSGPTITALNPDHVVAGDPEFTLTVTGTGFATGSIVCWNKLQRPTTYVSATQVKAHIFTRDLTTPGLIPVQVATGGSSGAPMTFTLFGSGSGLPQASPGLTKAASASTVVDPVTVGAISLALDAALDHLNQVLQDAAQSLIAVGQSLEGNGHAVLNDLDERLKDQFSTVYTDLQKEERQLAEDAKKLTDQINVAANQLVLHAGEQARLTMSAADQLAYATTQNLPCQNHVGRALYVTTLNEQSPFDLRLGVDANEITLHGNWLNQIAQPEVTVDGKPCVYTTSPSSDCTVAAVGEREIVIRFTPGFIPDTGGTEGRSVQVTVATNICTCHWLTTSLSAGPINSVTFHAIPRKQYNVYSRIWATAVADSAAIWDYVQSFYHAEPDCDGYSDQTHTFNLPDPISYRLIAETPVQIVKTTENCNSDIDGSPVINSPSSVTVRAHVGGCGKNFFVNCKGHGWLGYTINFHYVRRSRQPMPTVEAVRVVPGSGTPTTIQFPYTASFPTGATDTQWHYYLKIIVTQGGSTTELEFSEDNQSGAGITTSQNQQTGAVSVTLPPTLILAQPTATED